MAENRLWLGKDRALGRVAAIEAARDLARLLDVGQLVGADRDERRAAEQDIGRLVHRAAWCTG